MDEEAHNRFIDDLYALGGELQPVGEPRNMELLNHLAVPGIGFIQCILIQRKCDVHT